MLGSPWMLMGIAAAALIALAHRLFRQPARKLPFAALRFLPSSEQDPVAPNSWQDLGLMALRLSLWGLLAAALARPHCAVQQDLPVFQGPQAAFIVVDAGARSHHMVQGRSIWKRSLQKARDLVQALPAGSWVHLTALEPSFTQVQPGMDRTQALAILSSWEQAQAERGPFARQSVLELSASYDALQDAKAKAPASLSTIGYFIGEPTSAFHQQCPRTGAGLDRWICLGAYEDTKIQPPPHQLALSTLQLSAKKQVGRSTFELHSSIRDFGRLGQTSQDVEVQWFIDDIPIQRQKVSLEQGRGEASWYYGLTDNDPHRVRAEIVGSDAFGLDNKVEAWLTHDKPLRVLLVDGDPSEQRAQDEVFLLATALKQAFKNRGLSLRAIDPAQFQSLLQESPKGPEHTDVIVLANVSALSPEASGRLQSWVEGGGGLWMTAGSRIDASVYNQRFEALLPLLLRSANSAQPKPLELAAPSATHPLFSAFLDPTALRGGHTHRLYLLEPDPKREASVALSFANGAPALVTRQVQAGRVAWWSTSIDRAWTDLVLHPGFVPLGESIINWLAKDEDAHASSELRRVVAGTPVTLSSKQRVQIKGPLRSGVQSLDPETPFRPRILGLYESTRGGTKHPHRFVATLDPKASPPPQGASVAATPQQDDAVTSARSFRPIWRYLWPLIAIALVTESLLRMLRLRR